MVTDALIQQIYRDQQAILQQRKRRWPRRVLIIVTLLAGTAASAYVWLNFYSPVQGASSSSERSAAVPVGSRGGEAMAGKDFQEFQKHTTDFLQSVAQDIAAQKVQLKSLSDQVAGLAARIDAIQSEAAPTPRPVAAQPAIPLRPIVTSSRKKPAPGNLGGRISVGGAPLPPASAGDGRQ